MSDLRLLDAAELAELLEVPKTWLLREARADRIPHIRLGRYVRFDPEEIRAWLKARHQGACISALTSLQRFSVIRPLQLAGRTFQTPAAVLASTTGACISKLRCSEENRGLPYFNQLLALSLKASFPVGGNCPRHLQVAYCFIEFIETSGGCIKIRRCCSALANWHHLPESVPDGIAGLFTDGHAASFAPCGAWLTIHRDMARLGWA